MQIFCQMKAVTVIWVVFTFSSMTVKGDGSINDCNFCAWDKCRPTVRGISDEEFNAETDAKSIKKAIGVIHVKKDVIFNILSRRTDNQKVKIMSAYNRIYKPKKMAEDINDIVYGDMNRLLDNMVYPLSHFYANELKRFIERKQLENIVEVLTILPSCALDQVREHYEKINKKPIKDDLSTLHLNFDKERVVKFLIFLAEGNRQDKQEVIMEETKAKESSWARVFKKGKSEETELFNHKKDVETLQKVIERDSWEEKHQTFQEIFGTRSLPHLRDMISHYNAMAVETTLDEDITKKARLETAGTMYLTIVKIATNQPMYFAEKLDEVLKPTMMHNVSRKNLNTIIQGRCSVDLGDIKKAYFERNKSKLHQVISNKIFNKLNEYYTAILNLIKED